MARVNVDILGISKLKWTGMGEFNSDDHYIWRRHWQPIPVLLSGKSHGRRSLVGCSPWSRKKSDTTEWLHFHFSLSCIGEGNGNPLSVLAWRIPGTEEPGRLLSMGLHRVGHHWSDLAAAADHYIYYCGQESLRRNGNHSQQKSPTCSTWMQSQKRKNLC